MKSHEGIEVLELEIVSLTERPYTHPKAYTATLAVIDDNTTKIAMGIDKSDAQYLAVAIENIKPEYPLPLDLLESTIIEFGFSATEVIIDNIVEGVYTSRIIFKKDDKFFKLPARTSDSMTMAIKFNCPIYIDKKLVEI